MEVLTPDDKARHAITAGLRANEELIFKFTQAWYNQPYTFRTVKVLGFPACKIPLDLFVLMDLFTQYRFQTVIETGTAGGGTTLWYAVLMDLLGIKGGKVISVDVNAIGDMNGEDTIRPEHPRIQYIKGGSTDPETFAAVRQAMGLDPVEPVDGDPPIRQRVVGPLLVNLDSDHHAPHVLKELALYAPLLKVNDWLVVEDTNAGPAVRDAVTGKVYTVEGPMAAVLEFLGAHPGEFLQDVICERFWLSMNPRGWLMRVELPQKETA